GLALLLSAAALLVHAGDDAAAATVAGLAAGLAIATKVTMVVPVAALTIGVAGGALARRQLRLAAAWVVPLVLAGGTWYVRNWVRVGNPVPNLAVHVGPLRLPSPPMPA